MKPIRCAPHFARTMARFLTRSTMCLIALIGVAHASDDYTDRSIVGKWKFTAVLDFADISALDERQAHQLVGKTLVITEEKIAFGKRTCDEPDFAAESVEPTLHLREQAHASAENLRLPTPVTVIDLACATAYVRNPEELVLSWNGVFLNAVRIEQPALKKARQPQPRPAGKAEPGKVQRALMPLEAP